MFGKLKKAVKGVKKVVNKSPVHKATAKAVGRTGGPLGKAIAKRMTTGGNQPASRTVGSAGGRGPQTLGTGVKIGGGPISTTPKDRDGSRLRKLGRAQARVRR